MYVPFILYVLTISIVLGLILSKKFRKWFLIVVISVTLIAATLSLHGIARAEQTEEVRTCWIVPFTYHNFATGTFTVEDEDGYLWDFYLGEGSYIVGDEYTLHLPVNEDPWLEEEVLVDELCAC